MGREFLAVDDQGGLEIAGQDPGPPGAPIGTTTTTAAEETAGRRCGALGSGDRLDPIVPAHRVHPGRQARLDVITRQLADQIAGAILDDDAKAVGLGLEPIGDRYAQRRIGTDVLHVALARVISEALRGLLVGRRHGVDVPFGHLGLARLLERRQVVENPNAPAMGREQHRVLTRVKGDLIDRYGGQVAPDPAPRLPAIEGQI